jgi:hypothetical protein
MAAMYFDNKPCEVCGSEVRLRARQQASADGEPGDRDPDATLDERVCTNSECDTNRMSGADAPSP